MAHARRRRPLSLPGRGSAAGARDRGLPGRPKSHRPDDPVSLRPAVAASPLGMVGLVALTGRRSARGREAPDVHQAGAARAGRDAWRPGRRRSWRSSTSKASSSIEDVFSPAQCAEMAEEFDRLHRAKGERGGHEVHVEPGAPRVSNIFNKSAAYDACLTAAPILGGRPSAAGENKVHGANLRDPLPGQGRQALHCDVPSASSTTGGSSTPWS